MLLVINVLLVSGKRKGLGADYHPADNDIEHCGLGFFCLFDSRAARGEDFLVQRGRVGGGGLSSCWFMLAIGCVCKIPFIEEVDMGLSVYSGKFKGSIEIVRFIYH